MSRQDLETRLKPFLDRGLIDGVPTQWQLVVGQFEMAPYVVLPDAGDAERYDGARFGHPLARTPIVLSQIGWEHFRIGSGLGASLRAVIRHCAYVYHEGMPTYDLQLVQTHENGLDILRRKFETIQQRDSLGARRDHLLTSLVIPDAAGYRQLYLEEGGYIDRAAAFDYPPIDAEFLRPEFATVPGFLNYCLHEIEAEAPRGVGAKLSRIREAAGARFREDSRGLEPSIALSRLFGRG